MHDPACRQWFERYRPGGWWRRDVVLAVLDEMYPRWVRADEVQAICCAIRSDWLGKYSRNADPYTARALSRLHACRLVDRIGRPKVLAGRVKGNDWQRGWMRCEGYRYRLIRRVDPLL